MPSLFQGSPQTATSYATTSTETPKWMQDAIYNQIQWATNVANTPYQAYDLPTVAELSPLQQQAYRNVVANQGTWQPAAQKASSGMEAMSSAGTAGQLRQEQGQYLQPGMAASNLQSGQNYFNQAGRMDIAGAAQPALNRAMGIDAVAAASPYLSQAASQNLMGAAQPYLSRAASQDIAGAAQPMLNRAADTTAASVSERALAAANPYLQASAASSASNVGTYMNPYQQGVLDVIARQGARNLTENIMPGVSDAFIKAGQFGSSRMGEMGSRAIRDTQEAVLNAQSQAAQQGYGQALSAAQADLSRQAQLASTVGGISGADLSRIMQGGSQFANIGQTQGQLTAQQAQMLANLGQTSGQLTGQQAQILSNLGQTQGQLSAQQMQNLTNLGQTQGQLTAQQMSQLAALGQAQTQAGQAQQQYGINAAQAAQSAQAQDYQRQMGALTQMSNMAQQGQAMRAADVAALEAAGAAQQSQLQRELTAAQQQWEAARLYPQQQLDWLNAQIRGMAPVTPQTQTQTRTSTGETYSPSPLSQLASGLAVSKGLQNIS